MFGARSLGLALVLLLPDCNHDASPAAVSSPPVPSADPAVTQPSAVAAPNPAPVAPLGLLAVGSDVPDVTAAAQDGSKVSLRALKGKPLVVYFYPKDDTPGCTIEAKGIRDQYAELKSLAVVLGVSADSLDSHRSFAEKYDLPFLLLDDTSHVLTTAFGVPVSSGHAKRVTFVIDASGKVREVFPDVVPAEHAAALIAALKRLG